MKKQSNAEKLRRKEVNILHHGEHLLNIIWACRDNAVYNNYHWNEKDQSKYMTAWREFQYGCLLADGRKWYNRLEKQFADYEAEHGSCVKERRWQQEN